MKKVIAGIAATVLAAAMCVSFAACGGSGAEKAKDIKGEEVTAEQWTAAFEALEKADAEYTVTQKIVETYSIKNVTDPDDTNKKLSGSQTLTSDIVYSKKGNKEHQITTNTTKLTGDARRIMAIMGLSEDEIPEEDTTTETEELYGEKTEPINGYVLYEQNADGTWRKGDGRPFTPPLGDYKTQYENYIYSAENKGYISKDYSAEDKDELEVFKFDKDGKLVAVYCEMPTESEEDDDGSEMTTTYTGSSIIEYSAKDITLPTVA